MIFTSVIKAIQDGLDRPDNLSTPEGFTEFAQVWITNQGTPDESAEAYDLVERACVYTQLSAVKQTSTVTNRVICLYITVPHYNQATAIVRNLTALSIRCYLSHEVIRG